MQHNDNSRAPIILEHRRRPPALCIHALALLGVLSSACSQRAVSVKPAEEAVAVVTAAVEAREYALPIEAIGTARAEESVLVTSRVSGRVRNIYMTDGAFVREGDPLVLLEDDAGRAAARSAEAAAAEAASHHARLEALAEQGLVSAYERDRQRQAMETAQAELELARVLLDQRTIRAPFSGVVGFRQISPGTLVQPGSGIVTLDAHRRIRVVFSVAETLIGNLTVGDTVQASTAAYRERMYAGTIETLGTRVEESTRAVPVQAAFDNLDGSLLPGMMIAVRILAKPRMLTYVPEAALAPENARQFVWQVTAAGTAQRVPVEIGMRGMGWVEILTGLMPGDRVVLEGAGNLRPQVAVREVARPGVTLAGVGGET